MYWHNPVDRDAIAAELDTLGGIEVTRSYAMNIEIMGEGRDQGNGPHVAMRASGRVSPTPGRLATTSTTFPCCRQRATAWHTINAEPEDRDAADAITEYDNDHDGVARTIMAALA